MIPTFAQVAEHCRRAYLGDTQVPGGSMWSNNALMTHSTGGDAAGPVPAAYGVLIQAMMLKNHRKLQRSSYYNLPANTSRINPSSMGIANISSPIMLFERGIRNQIDGLVSTPTITVVTPVVKTSIAPESVGITFSGTHPFTSGQAVLAYNFIGYSPEINDEFVVSVPDSTHITLNGCPATTLPLPTTQSIGVLTDSQEVWPATPMTQYTDLDQLGLAAGATLDRYAWVDNAFRFRGCTATRQLKIVYKLSSQVPDDINRSTYVDGCLDFLACYASARAIQTKGAGNAASTLFMQACGNPNGDPLDGNAGMLGQLLREEIKQQQMLRVVAPRFRPRRNTGPFPRY